MPKFKNWSKVDNPGRIRRYRRPVKDLWRHDSKPFEAVILEEDAEVMHKTSAKEYGVLKTKVINNGTRFQNISKPRKFDRIEDARKNARSWIDENPSPS